MAFIITEPAVLLLTANGRVARSVDGINRILLGEKSLVVVDAVV